jgi:MFS family permease
MAAKPSTARPHPLSWLWRRQLAGYPRGNYRNFLIAFVIVVSLSSGIVTFIAGAITPTLLPQLHMSTSTYSDTQIIFFGISLITLYIGSFTDRFGRANLMVFGTIGTGLVALVFLPMQTTATGYLVWYAILGFADGIALFGAVALVRDYTTVSRRSAALGASVLLAPIGAFITNFTSGNIKFLEPSHGVYHLFEADGIFMLVMGGLSLFLLKELPPRLRGRQIFSDADRDAIEAQMDTVDDAQVASTVLEHRWRKILTFPFISSNIAIFGFILLYYTYVGYAVLYLTGAKGLTVAHAHDLVSWFWGFQAIVIIPAGLLSDRLHIRKLPMIAWSVVTVISTAFLTFMGHLSYTDMIPIFAVSGASMAASYASWIASVTEEVEALEAGLVGSALAMVNWTVKLAAIAAFFLVPRVIGAPATKDGWQSWMIICLAGTALFCVFASFITGPWLPRAGKAVFDRRRAATLEAKPEPSEIPSFGPGRARQRLIVAEESVE